MVFTEISSTYPTVASVVSSGGVFAWQHYVIYLNAALLTVLTAAVFSGFCVIYADDFPLATRIAGVFIPVYAVGNFVAYLSQVILLPRMAETASIDLVFQWIQTADGSIVQFINILSYAVLGIPSILIGRVLVRDPVGSSVGGTLLIISGLLSMLALAGFAAANVVLLLMSLVSGGVFLIALIVIAARMSKG